MLSPLSSLILLSVGILAGFLNVVAGGGSLLTMPALIFLGLPASTANGTNRVAILAQNIAAMIKFRRQGFHDFKLGARLSVLAMIGAVFGSQIAITISDALFKQILSGVMLLVVAGMFLKRSKPGTPVENETIRRPRLQLLLFFIIGVYGGFIQAGVGFLLIFALATVGGLSLVRTNSLKVIVIGLYMCPSLLVFVLQDKVAWIPAIVMAVGNSLGGWLGSAFSVKKGDQWIRLVLALAVAAMAGRLAGLY